jgi:hypothetical protein
MDPRHTVGYFAPTYGASGRRRIGFYVDEGCSIQVAKQHATNEMGPVLSPRFKEKDSAERERIKVEIWKGENWENLRSRFGEVVLAMIITGREAIVDFYPSQ